MLTPRFFAFCLWVTLFAGAPCLALEGDCNGNAIDDGEDIRNAGSEDCNSDGIPDECQETSLAFDAVGSALSVPSSSGELVATDLDHDGDIDLALGAAWNLSVYSNREVGGPLGFEGLSPPVNYAVGSRITSVRSGDVDGDGSIDLVTLSTLSISVFWNRGDGSFPESTTVPIPRRSVGLSLLDANGDDLLELATANRNEGLAYVFFNREKRRFGPPLRFSVDGSPSSLHSGDMDGDGDTDLMIANIDPPEVVIMFNDNDLEGSLSFSRQLSVPLESPPADSILGDFNGDGVLDFAVAAGNVTIWFNHGDGSEFERNVFHTDSTRIDVADVDGDGDLDLLSNSRNDTSLSVLLNSEGGDFHAILDFDFRSSIASFKGGDFDGDGRPDLAVSHGNRSLAFFRNMPRSSVSVKSAQAISTALPHTIGLGDLDGDGDLDAAVGNGHFGNISILTNDGGGVFNFQRSVHIPSDVEVLTIDDLDRDGDDDLIAAGGSLWVLENNGQGEFPSAQMRALRGVSTTCYVITADLDGDDLPDLITTDCSGTVTTLLNDQSGGFQRRRTVRAGIGTRSVAAGDFDGDGDQDLVVAERDSQELAVLKNRGDGVLDAIELFAAGGNPSFVVSGDWNKDGFPDVAATHTDTVGIYLNLQNGTFSSPQFLGDLRGPAILAPPADMNGDGFVDLIATSPASATVTFLLNDREGGFIIGDSIQTGISPRFTDIGDVDGDGDMDLVIANHDSREVLVHLNDTMRRLGRPFAEHVCTGTDFEELSSRVSKSLSVKYTLPAREDPTLLPPLFQNGKIYPLHHEFLSAEFPDRFPALTALGLIGLTQVRATRDYHIGAVQRIRNPADTGFLYIYSILTAPGREEVLTLEEVRWVDETMREALTLEPLAYAPDPTGEAPLAREAAESWVDPGFPIFFGTAITDSEYIPYTQGVGYGRVRILPKEQFDDLNASGRLTFQDIAVIDHAPRDIEGLVGGVITAAPQGVLSHVAVRTARRGTPNAFVSQALGVFASYKGLLVRLEVEEREYTIQEVTQEEAEEFWSNRPALQPLAPFDADYGGLDRFEEMEFASGVPLESRFGGKATSLARLQTILTGPYQEYREEGFAIPIRYYLEFMRENTMPSAVDPNREVTYQQYLAELFQTVEFQTNSEFRFQALNSFRDRAREEGVVSEDLIAALAERIEEVFGSTEIMVRFRSSSNIEDLLDFNGAGLYESTSACAADTLDRADRNSSHCDPTRNNERTIERALKKVWTSLWTFRAYEERWFYQVPQESAAMGILVNRAFLDEAANGVAFTGDPTNPRGGCYLAAVQVGEESVVSPEPGVLAEVNLLEVADGQVQRIVRSQRSSLVRPGELVLSGEKVSELGALMWHIDKNYPLDTEGRERDEILLDLEFKLERDGSLSVKQIRPFLPSGERKKRPTFELQVPPETVVCGGLNLISPSGDIRAEYESKSMVRFIAQTVELPSSECTFTGELFEEVLVGPEGELALLQGPGLFRVEERPNPGGNRTIHTFSFRQLFSLSGDRTFEVNLFNLQFTSVEGNALSETLVLNEHFIHEKLTMLGFAEDPDLTVTYASCTNALLPEWEMEAELVDGTTVRLRERFLPPEDFTRTGPASLQAAEVLIGGSQRLVTSYWDLVYASGRHNIGVVYWVLLDPPVSLEGIEAPIYAVELRAPDRPEVLDLVAVPQVAGAAYLDENFEVLGEPEVVSFEKREAVGEPQERFLRGDANADGAVDTADAVTVLSYLFLQGASPPCRKAADATDDGRINLPDAIEVLLHAFGGRALPAPSSTCGVDPTPDELSCEQFPACF